MSTLIAVLAAYLLGSLSFAVIVVRFLQGRDLRAFGSGNAGATNVLRAAGGPAAALVLVLDLLKGAIPVAAARAFGCGPAAVGGAAVAAVLGHVYPVFFGFRGGKGVATAAGSFAVLLPVASLAALAVFGLTVVSTRIVSLGSMVAALTLPLLAWLLGAVQLTAPPPREVLLGACGIALLVLVKHQANVRRLIAGNEPRLGNSVEESEE